MFLTDMRPRYADRVAPVGPPPQISTDVVSHSWVSFVIMLEASTESEGTLGRTDEIYERKTET